MEDFKNVLNEALNIPPTPEQIQNIISEEERKSQITNKLIDKLTRCLDYQSVYALEEEFNKAGLTIQTTSNNRIILCRLQEGKAVTENIIDDYIFIGSLETAINEITDRAVMKISDFIRTNASAADKVRNTARVWRNGLKMYESTVIIMNEDKQISAMPDAQPMGFQDRIKIITESIGGE